jgi:hypothetical protein
MLDSGSEVGKPSARAGTASIARSHIAGNRATIDVTVQDRERQLDLIGALEPYFVAVTRRSSNRVVGTLGLPKITVNTRPTVPNHHSAHTPAYPVLDVELANGCGLIAMRLSMID